MALMKRERTRSRRTAFPVQIKRRRTEFPNQTKLRRTAFPDHPDNGFRKYSAEEIYESLSHTEKAKLLIIQTEIEADIINLKNNVYRLGERLTEAKDTVPHGMFMSWIEVAFKDELPYSTAYFYMRVYKVFKDNPRTIQYIPTRYLLTVTNNEFPEEIIKLLNESPEKLNKVALNEINELFIDFRKGRIGNSQFVKLAEEQIKLGLNILKGRTKHRLNMNMRKSLEYGTGDLLKHIKHLQKIASEMAGLFPYDPDSTTHKKLIKYLDDTIKELQKLKIELEGGDGFRKEISTEDGDVYV